MKEAEMEIAVTRPDSVKATVTPAGRVDADSGSQLRQALQTLAAEGVLLIVVDLQQVDFMDSSGLSALVSGLRALREHAGSLHLCRPQPQPLTALKLTMLDRVFPIFATPEEALDFDQAVSP
jgi:anti-sigma B factor antagonist